MFDNPNQIPIRCSFTVELESNTIDNAKKNKNSEAVVIFQVMNELVEDCVQKIEIQEYLM